MTFNKLVSLQEIDTTIEYIEGNPNIIHIFEYSLQLYVIAILMVQSICFLNSLMHSYNKLVGG